MYSKPVSPSSLKLWKECPFKWADCYIHGNRQPPGAAAQRGTDLHNMLEDFFNGSPYPSGNKTLAPWQRLMEGLAATDCTAEGEIAVDRNWQQIDYKSPFAYYRGKKDLHYEHGTTLNLYDWKSGKIYDDHEFQGASYAAMSPNYEIVNVRFVYLDHPHVIKSWTYTTQEVAAKRVEFSTLIEEVRLAEEYPATPGDGCTWCHLSWRRGGSCKRAR